jgi:hypothetical protein
MITARIIKLLSAVILLIVLSSCDSSSQEYFFEQPASFSVLKGSKCLNGTVSYMGFVVDNTQKYGARLMKISGCSSKIDKDFKDETDDKTGIYIGGTGISSDQMVIDKEVIFATASSGYAEFEHWKNKDEKLRLDKHSGRIVFRKMNADMKHDDSFNRSILLDFYPSIVKAYKGDGFFFSGSRFGRNYLGFADVTGKGDHKEIILVVSDIAVAGDLIYIFDSTSGSVYEIDSLLEPVLKLTDPDLIGAGMTAISQNRIVFYNKNDIRVVNSALDTVKTVKMFEGNDISSVTSVKYDETFEYRDFSKEKMNEFVKIYEKEEEEDSDIADEDVIAKEDDNDEVSDEDTAFDDEKVIDASEGDVLWIASKKGNVMAYDMKNSSWIVIKYSESEALSNPDYYNEMRPYIDSTYTTYPKNGRTDPSNAPYISSVYAVRGIPHSLTYKFIYEGIFEETLSGNGSLNEERTVLTDKTVDFEKFSINPTTDYITLLNRINSVDCVIPWNENAVFSITEVVSSSQLGVKIDKYKDQIEKCYGDPFNYAIFPKERYSVSRESYYGSEFAGKGIELPADSEGGEFSFSDDYVGISIKRTTDDVVTEKETSFFIKLNPGVPFAGFSSSDVSTFMANPASGKVLLFSPLTRRIVEYDIPAGKILKIYK